jgi:hypothetical protein
MGATAGDDRQRNDPVERDRVTRVTKRKNPPKVSVGTKVPDWGALRSAATEVLHSIAANPADLDGMAEKYASLSVDYWIGRRIEPQAATEVERNLAALKDHVAGAANDLALLRSPTLDAVVDAMRGSGLPTLAQIENLLAGFSDRLRHAKVPASAKDSKGRAAAADKIASTAAEDYFTLTGKVPNRSGNRNNFSDFLQAIFDALQIKEKASSYLQKAFNNWKARQGDTLVKE